MFKDITTDLVSAGEVIHSNLQALCPTRWVVRVRCLRSIEENWKPLQMVFEKKNAADENTKKEVRAKAIGVLKKCIRSKHY